VRRNSPFYDAEIDPLPKSCDGRAKLSHPTTPFESKGNSFNEAVGFVLMNFLKGMVFMLIESLESRCHFAADPLAGASSVGIHMGFEGSTLRITTLDADNVVRVWKDGIYLQLDIRSSAFDNRGNPISARQQNRYDYDKVRKIVIDAGAGNDSIEISSKIKAHATVYGGAGLDGITTGSGNDKIYGGDGTDYLTGNAGDDFLDGGDGDDYLRAIGGNDSLWGNTGNDRLIVESLGHRINGGPGRDTATLRDAPTRIERVERFTQEDYDLVPVASAPHARIEAVNVSSKGVVSMDVFGNGIRYAYTVGLQHNTGRVNVNLLPYRFIEPAGSIVTYVQTQTISLGKLGSDYNTIILRVSGVEVDRASLTMV
jgi:hypothetical protein